MKVVARRSDLIVVAVELSFPLSLLAWRFYLRHFSTVLAVELEPASHLLPLLVPQLGILIWSSLHRLRNGLPPWWSAALVVVGQLTLAACGGWGTITAAPSLVFASTLLIVLRGPWCWVLFSVATAGAAAGFGATWVPTSAMFAMFLLNLLMGVVIYATVRMAELAITLRRTQGVLAEFTVVQERTRVSRDLHDKLGQELTAVGLRAELAMRLMTTQPGRAAAELKAVQEMTERALRGVREVARNQWQPVFEDELRTGTALLESAGVKWEVNVCAKPQGQAAHVAGWVVREAITNVLTHSTAARCVITADDRGGNFSLTIENDGVRGGGGQPGTGLTGLTDRVALLGGRVWYGLVDKGRFRLVVEIPTEGER